MRICLLVNDRAQVRINLHLRRLSSIVCERSVLDSHTNFSLSLLWHESFKLLCLWTHYRFIISHNSVWMFDFSGRFIGEQVSTRGGSCVDGFEGARSLKLASVAADNARDRTIFRPVRPIVHLSLLDGIPSAAITRPMVSRSLAARRTSPARMHTLSNGHNLSWLRT